jgi:hypothetical protein
MKVRRNWQTRQRDVGKADGALPLVVVEPYCKGGPHGTETQ